MPTFALVLSCLIPNFLVAQIESLRSIICSYNWQEDQTSIVWTFTDSGTFTACRFWMNLNKKQGGFALKKGTFQLEDSAKIMRVTFDSTYTIYSKDSISISSNTDTQVWNLVTVTDNKLVVKRPPVWEPEKRRVTGNNQITAILEGGKKRRKDKK
jgi:hypothetical protein